MARVIIGQWENECVSLSILSMVRVQFPAMAEYSKGFPLWLITLCQPALSQRGGTWLTLPPQ